MARRLTVLLSILLTVTARSSAAQDGALVRGNAPGEWRVWGADAWSTRYSPLDQINASNFDSLQVAWQWPAGAFGLDEYYRTTPLYANGRLFTVTSTRRVVVALDPERGEALWMWRLDEGIRWQKAPRQFAGRGLAYWTDGREERVIVVTPGYHLASLDAKTGIPDPKFGKDGVVDLMDGLGLPLVPVAVDDSGPLIISDAAPMRRARPGEKWDPVTKTGADGTIGIDPAYGQIASSSPAILVNDVIVVGNSSIHGYYPIRFRNIPGFIRGFDVRTGKQLWKFNLVPQPGEFGAETWKNGSKIGTEGVGKNDAWATYAADPELGLVYIPVGMPLLDEYGGHRPGDNLYGNSIVAIDTKTGQRRWHFQMVHHDIWDYDTPMSPNLLDVTINGRPRKIVAQTTKQGFMYVFDRVTGEPIWPIVETPVLQSEVPGEQTSPTQPIPSKPAPYAHQGLEEDDLIDYTPAIRDSALKLAKLCRMGPYYIPASPTDGTAPSGFRCSWYAPGAGGGVNIDGGTAADPETGMLYVGSQSGLATIQVQKDPCSEFRYSSPRDNCGLIGALPPPPGYTPPSGRGGGFEGRAAGSTIGGVSILKPKQLGGVTGYDMKTGEKTWWIPNGTMVTVTSNHPLFAGVNLPQVGGRGQAQIITTRTLVIYGTGRSGVDNPPGLYAVDKATGKQVGKVTIPSRTTAMPMTFLHQGRQYIVFATGAVTNTSLVAVALPRAALRQEAWMKPLIILAAGTFAASLLQAQSPVNDLPNPYRTVEGWARMPEGRTWGSLSAVAIDKDGVSIWVAERCAANSCLGSTLDPVLKFDSTGRLVTSFGAGLILSPHGIDVDREGNVWVTDCACTGNSARDSTRGHQVFKFSPTGTLLMTLGTKGGAREPGYFYQPNDVLIAPSGDIYVSDGHSSREGANARILKFTKDGALVATWGKKGTGPGEFDQPHALAMDSRGRLFVGDRSNNRIQILDQNGTFLAEWTQFSRPSGLFIDQHDNLYVADSESGSVAPGHAGWKRGIRIGNAKDGSVTAFIPDPSETTTGTSAAEGVAVDARGNVYGAEVGPRALKKYVRR